MANAEPTWTIVGQAEDFRQDERGNFVQGFVVTFRTASGATGTVFVPADRYTVDEVRQRVSAMAQTVQAVAGLTG